MSRLAWSLCAISVALTLAGWVLTLAGDDVTLLFGFVATLALLTFPVVGALIASRRPANATRCLMEHDGLEPRGSLELKGKPAPVAVYALRAS